MCTVDGQGVTHVPEALLGMKDNAERFPIAGTTAERAVLSAPVPAGQDG